MFELTVQTFPSSWNAYDSLAEAYVAAGNDRRAILNYEKSMELNPDNVKGRTALHELKEN